jgi:hypothetical protein
MAGRALFLILLFASTSLQAEPVEWPITDGGNGHFYEFLDAVTWRQAFDASGTMSFNGCQGHLVTLASENEEVWIKQTFPVREFLFIGLYQPESSPEPDGGWRWVTDEPVTYTNWQGEEPNNGIPGEDYVGINPLPYGLGGWVDIWDFYSSAAIIEYDVDGSVDTNGSTWSTLKTSYR